MKIFKYSRSLNNGGARLLNDNLEPANDNATSAEKEAV